MECIYYITQTLSRWNVFTLVLTLYYTRKSLLPCGIVVADGVRGSKVELSYTITSLRQYSLAATRFPRGLCRRATIFPRELCRRDTHSIPYYSDSIPCYIADCLYYSLKCMSNRMCIQLKTSFTLVYIQCISGKI